MPPNNRSVAKFENKLLLRPFSSFSAATAAAAAAAAAAALAEAPAVVPVAEDEVRARFDGDAPSESTDDVDSRPD